MTTLDRYIFRSLLVNYLIALGVMISLYIVLDMFFNMDEFTESGRPAAGLLADLISFYGNRTFLYFAQLSGVITLFSCLLTLARMRTDNELTAMLASGISLYRVAAPVLAFGLVTAGLNHLNTEIAIPHAAHKLARRHDDARGLKTYGVWFLEDRDNALLSAQQYLPRAKLLRHLLVLNRSDNGDLQRVILAEQASWQQPEAGQPGYWALERGVEMRRVDPNAESIGPTQDMQRRLIDRYPSNLDPRSIELRQSAGWIRFLSSSKLNELASQVDGRLLAQVRDAKHARFTAPLISLLMLLLGVPFILDRRPGNLLDASVKCLLVCGSCYLLTFIVQNTGSETSGSALPAWLPMIIYTPITAFLLDRMRT
jgi:lipopolysaccharide export system permease protein